MCYLRQVCGRHPAVKLDSLTIQSQFKQFTLNNFMEMTCTDRRLRKTDKQTWRRQNTAQKTNAI